MRTETLPSSECEIREQFQKRRLSKLARSGEQPLLVQPILLLLHHPDSSCSERAFKLGKLYFSLLKPLRRAGRALQETKLSDRPVHVESGELRHMEQFIFGTFFILFKSLQNQSSHPKKLASSRAIERAEAEHIQLQLADQEWKVSSIQIIKLEV